MRRWYLSLVAAAAWLALPVQAEPLADPALPGHVEGAVRNEEGFPVAGARITGPSQLTATTNADGFYRLDNVGAGDVDLTATAAGYRPSTVRIRVVDDSTTRTDFSLVRETSDR